MGATATPVALPAARDTAILHHGAILCGAALDGNASAAQVPPC